MREFITLLALFMLSVYLGYVWAVNNPELSERLIKDLFESFVFIKDLPSVVIFLMIFVNNAVKSLISMLLGLFFGIIPIMFVISNGFILGMVSGVVSKDVGIWRVMLMLIPHGILEIPAVLIACSYGLRLGLAIIKKLRGIRVNLTDELKRALSDYIKYVVPLLLIAAFVETYITPIISQA